MKFYFVFTLGQFIGEGNQKLSIPCSLYKGQTADTSEVVAFLGVLVLRKVPDLSVRYYSRKIFSILFDFNKNIQCDFLRCLFRREHKSRMDRCRSKSSYARWRTLSASTNFDNIKSPYFHQLRTSADFRQCRPHRLLITLFTIVLPGGWE